LKNLYPNSVLVEHDQSSMIYFLLMINQPLCKVLENPCHGCPLSKFFKLRVEVGDN